jgi:hypothetical protein
MTKKLSWWLRWPLVLGLSAVAGWVTTSAVIQRRISAVWQDVPMRKVSMYPAMMGRGVEARVSSLAKRESLVDFAAWLGELAVESSPERLRAALDAARRLPHQWQMIAAETALARLADIDPRAALDYALLRLGDGSVGWNALANLVRARAAENPESLRPYLTAVARQLTRGQGGVEMLAKLSPEESLAFVWRWQLPLDHPGVKECVHGAIEKLGRTDPARALQVLENFGDMADGHRQGLAQTIAYFWITQSPEAALRWIQEHSGKPADPFTDIDRDGFLEATAIGYLARSDPEVLVDWAKSCPAGPNRSGDYPMHRALAILRTENAEAAWQVLTTVVPPPQQAAVAGGLLDNRLGTVTISALEAKSDIAWLTAWPPEWRSSSSPLREIDALLPDAEFHQWLTLGMKLSPAAIARVADGVESDLAAALAGFRDSSPAAQRSALPGMIDGLVNTDPARAAALLQTLPRGEAWANAAAQLATEWSRFERPAAESWISTLPPGMAQRLRAEVAKGAAAAR